MSISLADAIFWIAVACCTVAQLAIFRSIIATPASASSAPPGRRRVVEVAWAVLPGVALAAVLFYTWAAIHAPVASAIATLTP